MRDTLPDTPNHVEYGIQNLDSIQNTGTHWTLWYKNENDCFYFDSLEMDPPEEFKSYIRSLPIICSNMVSNCCGSMSHRTLDVLAPSISVIGDVEMRS